MLYNLIDKKMIEHETLHRRTSGDGMENEEIKNLTSEIKSSKVNEDKHLLRPHHDKIVIKKNANDKVPGQFILYRPDNESKCLLPAIPKGKLYGLIPKLVKKTKDQSESSFKKIREPRFIPIEPYKAAVNPIIPLKKHKKTSVIKKNKNNLDINFIISQVSQMKTSELEDKNTDKKQQNSKYQESKNKTGDDIDIEKKRLQKENEDLKKDKDHINGQLKFQLQVNSELKNLLVASVGEDLQTKVNVLTEDKLQLARALLDTAKNLSTHAEQIEFLAGQCEVWRSKFLASSVMIEELARWKADLQQKNFTLIESNRRTLQLISKLRDMQIEILKNLRFLKNIKQLNLPSSDIVSLTSECLNISEQMVLHSGIGIPSTLNLNNLDILTDTEKFAAKALQNQNQSLAATEEASKAIVDQAFSTKSLLHDSTKTMIAINNNDSVS